MTHYLLILLTFSYGEMDHVEVEMLNGNGPVYRQRGTNQDVAGEHVTVSGLSESRTTNTCFDVKDDCE